jgi:hypothetical protein
MLLAAAKRNRHALFYGADLDVTCCKMALVNMLFNSLTGEIAHMNSLTNEFFKGYQCCTTLVNGFHTPYYVKFSEPELSRIWLKPVAAISGFDKPFEPVRILQHTECVQGSLF